MEDIECAGFTFTSNYDSGNLARVELVKKREIMTVNTLPTRNFNTEEPEYEFNVWTKPDCYGTDFVNGNRTWFYFGIKGGVPFAMVKLNLVDLNKQAKMYSQGMAPVTKTVPGRSNWERIRDKVTYSVDDNIFTLSFRYCTPENLRTITYFAFTYPFSYTDLQNYLGNIEARILNPTKTKNPDDIYFLRECVCKSLEDRRIDLITVSSYYNITAEREPKLKNLFVDEKKYRPFKFKDKKIIFVSARVHPGETPSSFVFNGFLNFLLNRDNPVAIALRRLYVFKLIPFLNPDGVARGHYRTDTRGVNLNRVYLNPSQEFHPSVYAARTLIRYYHYGFEKEDVYEKYDFSLTGKSSSNIDLHSDDSVSNTNCSTPSQLNNTLARKVSVLTLNEDNLFNSKIFCVICKTPIDLEISNSYSEVNSHNSETNVLCESCYSLYTNKNKSNCDKKDIKNEINNDPPVESGLFLYIDLHGHASKKGIFMYGNHFDDLDRNVECMMLPKLMSLNNHNFHYTSCNFTERNMYLRDRRDGMSREGSGRVAVLKLTGLVRSYTLECNYNTGRIVNILPPTCRESSKISHILPIPPRYTPHIFEEVGKALGPSILDLTGSNPSSRLGNSEFHTLGGLRDWLRINYHRTRELSNSPQSKINAQVSRVSNRKISKLHTRPNKYTGKSTKCNDTSGKVLNDRKENVAVNSKTIHINLSQPCCSRTLFKSNLGSAKPSRSKFSTSGLKTKDFSIKKNKKEDIKFPPCANMKYKRDISLRLKGDSDKLQYSKETENTTSGGEYCDILTSKNIINQGSKRIKISSIRQKKSSSSSQPQMKLSELSFITASSRINTTSDSSNSSDSQISEHVNSWKSCSNAEVPSIQAHSGDKVKSVVGSKFNMKKRLLSTPKPISKSSNVKTVIKKKKIIKKNILRKLTTPLDGNFKKRGKKSKKQKK